MLYKNKTFTISYEVYGNKNNQPVLLLPQGTGFSSSLKRLVIFGYSYGGSTAIYLSKIMEAKALILVGTGNYFRYWQKILLSLIFVPTILLGIFRKIYAHVLTQYLGWHFHGFTDSQLKIINKRWYRSIWYRLPKYKSDIPALLLNSSNDRICSKESGVKLKEIYPNGKAILYSCGHYDYLNELEAGNFADIKQFLAETE